MNQYQVDFIINLTVPFSASAMNSHERLAYLDHRAGVVAAEEVGDLASGILALEVLFCPLTAHLVVASLRDESNSEMIIEEVSDAPVASEELKNIEVKLAQIGHILVCVGQALAMERKEDKHKDGFVMHGVRYKRACGGTCGRRTESGVRQRMLEGAGVHSLQKSCLHFLPHVSFQG